MTSVEDDRQIQFIKVGMDFTGTITKRILENLDGDDKESQLSIMRQIQADYIKMENEYNVSKKIISEFKKAMEAEDSDFCTKDVEAEYRNELKERLVDGALDYETIKRDKRFLRLEALISGAYSCIG